MAKKEIAILKKQIERLEIKDFDLTPVPGGGHQLTCQRAVPDGQMRPDRYFGHAVEVHESEDCRTDPIAATRYS